MHIQIVNFRLSGIDEQAFRALCDELAPAFASVPGLLTKVWLADPERGVYGGVYTWRDEDALNQYLTSDLFNAVLNHPNLVDISSQDFGILEGPTRVTRGMVSVAV
jgi:quinol monooxygenase YgiN